MAGYVVIRTLALLRQKCEEARFSVFLAGLQPALLCPRLSAGGLGWQKNT
jgi:hypothetical protein